MAKSIAFFAIAPPDYLDAFVAQEPASVHHVAAQRVLTDAAYRAFFHREAQRGAEIIVDNGVFDLGHALPAADLIAAARVVDAREIILPDSGLPRVPPRHLGRRAGRVVTRLAELGARPTSDRVGHQWWIGGVDGPRDVGGGGQWHGDLSGDQ
ncbi:hypothetical protein [Actinophytocola gossypii]|uniref:Uncharacterized protein n=1 Tax=Actinophytocola gossypii TaxID=2812003 RepID=A0ABT2J9T7_9PSEU|nr:hypothetical protein [Actinophytocola gossypii]MCT2584622.1 hypothetical protein [Actinophytocola gossypii]